MTTYLELQTMAAREGGHVERLHTVPHTAPYSVAHHTFNAVSLLLLLHPAPSLNLIKAVQFHDVAERWLGDLPNPVKVACPELRDLYERIEDETLDSLGLTFPLTTLEHMWARAVDLLEVWTWCHRHPADLWLIAVDCAKDWEALVHDHLIPSPLVEYASRLSFNQLPLPPTLTGLRAMVEAAHGPRNPGE